CARRRACGSASARATAFVCNPHARRWCGSSGDPGAARSYELVDDAALHTRVARATARRLRSRPSAVAGQALSVADRASSEAREALAERWFRSVCAGSLAGLASAVVDAAWARATAAE